MFHAALQVIRTQYSGAAARRDVAAIILHHRIQASPGYRGAARYVAEQLQAAGVDTRVERFPARCGLRFWTSPSFQEWTPRAATLHLLHETEEPEKLADFREMPLSLIQRSVSFTGDLPLLVLPEPLTAAAAADLDLAGKLVLTREPLAPVLVHAVAAGGAAGILFDGMATTAPVRPAGDLADARQYSSFWWTGADGEARCFGFVLTPRQGERLRSLARARQTVGEPPPRLRAFVDADLADGEFEVVVGEIAGESDDVVFLVSHLCHPLPSANDNATGCAANLEAARTLQALIDAGTLPRPRRTLRFLWMPEMTGTYAYLQRHEAAIPHFVGGLNLDMVGADQDQTGGVLCLERPPAAMSSFLPPLVESVAAALADELPSLSGLGRLGRWRMAAQPFSGGSDHYIFSDPTVGVPMGMLIQWPDRFYHTSEDTLSRVSADSLARSGTLAATVVYFLAAAGRRETHWLAEALQSAARRTIVERVQAWLTDFLEARPADPEARFARLEREVAFERARFQEALGTLTRLWSGAPRLAASHGAALQAAAQSELARARNGLDLLGVRLDEAPPAAARDGWETRAATLTPLRLYRGPAAHIGADALLEDADRAAWREIMAALPGGRMTLPPLVEYWIDGRRSGLDIIDLIELETGVRASRLVVVYLERLARRGLLEFV